MKVVFIKDHPSGIEKGAKHDFPEDHVQRLIDGGYVEGEGSKKTAPKKKESSKKD